MGESSVYEYAAKNETEQVKFEERGLRHRPPNWGQSLLLLGVSEEAKFGKTLFLG